MKEKIKRRLKEMTPGIAAQSSINDIGIHLKTIEKAVKEKSIKSWEDVFILEETNMLLRKIAEALQTEPK